MVLVQNILQATAIAFVLKHSTNFPLKLAAGLALQ